jgi:hypothetical protein
MKDEKFLQNKSEIVLKGGMAPPPPIIIGANIISIEPPNNRNTWYGQNTTNPWESFFYVEYYNKAMGLTKSSTLKISNSRYDDPDITIKFETPYTGPIKLYRSDNNNNVMKDEKFLQNKSEIVLKGGMAPPPPQPSNTVIGADINLIEGPNNSKTFYQSRSKTPYISFFFVEYYNINNTITESNKIRITNMTYDNPDIYIKFSRPYTGPIKLYRSDDNKTVIKDEKTLQNASDIVLRGGMAPTEESKIDIRCPPLDCNSDDIKTKMKDYYKKLFDYNYNILNITDSNLISNNKCKIDFSYIGMKEGKENGNGTRYVTFINENCNWKTHLMDNNL